MAENMRVRKPMLVAARLVDHLKSRCVALSGIWGTSSFMRSLTVLSSCIWYPRVATRPEGRVFSTWQAEGYRLKDVGAKPGGALGHAKPR